MRLFGFRCQIHALEISCANALVSIMLASSHLPAQGGVPGKEASMKYPTLYRTTQIEGVSIFYREAGPKDAPVLLLLHGLPSSSRMFEPLFARLSDRYHLVAPDYPGFGHSDWPDPKTFAYSFDQFADIMKRFTEKLGLAHYTLYMQDYGGPVGFRMALSHPERIEALIVQDAVAPCGNPPGRKLEDAQRVLGGSRSQRDCAARKSPFAGRNTHSASRKRSRRRTLRPRSVDR